jgi:hypothetical protein
MLDVDVSLPVRCPRCGITTLTSFPVLVVVTALETWNQMRLHAQCHDVGWDASVGELQSFREFLGRPWLESHRRRLAYEIAFSSANLKRPS